MSGNGPRVLRPRFVFIASSIVAVSAATNIQSNLYFEATTTPGGFHEPSPGGRIEGGVSFGQYRRITR